MHSKALPTSHFSPRRIAALCLCLVLPPLGTAWPADDRPKAPFRLLYSNDTTHTLSCISPYHHRGEPFSANLIEASVDETADTGVQVHLLQPGMGSVPWWKSDSYPFAEHARFLNDRYQAIPSKGSYADYMATGGDMVQVFVERCRQKKLVPFVSLRMNDGHGIELVDSPPGRLPGMAWHTLSRLHVEHPEWRIGPDLKSWDQRVFNWAIEGARTAKLRFVEELCRQYDLEGFELDFMRHPNYFRLNETTAAQRKAVMVDFIREVRTILDRTAREGRRRWLCARIPAYVVDHDPLGIDLGAWYAAGVDMFNLSYSYFTQQDGDLAAIRRAVPRSALYAEVCHTIHVGPAVVAREKRPGYDDFSFRRTTNEQFATTAHLAYARGLDGISTFNFVYYRQHGTGPRGPFCEPPFHVLKELRDPEWVAKQPQHYFRTPGWRKGGSPPRWLPATFQPQVPQTVELDLEPPADGWQHPGRLRIQGSKDLGDREWSCRLNGRELRTTAIRAEPYPNPYPALLGEPNEYRAWEVPADLPRPGLNRVELRLEKGPQAGVLFLDLAMPK